MAFDFNAMAELRHVSADRYQRNGGGGASKVYVTSKAYYDAMGHNDKSAWRRAVVEATQRWQTTSQIYREQFRIACLTSNEGFYHGDSIPF